MAVKTFTAPGTYTWVVPAGVTEITNVDMAGGQGGTDWSGNATGGNGGRYQITALASTTTAAPVMQTGVGSASVSISVDVAATAPALALAAGSAAVSVDAIFTALAAAILVASDGLSVETIDAVGALLYAWNGTTHVAVDLRYTDGAGLDVPATLELAE